MVRPSGEIKLVQASTEGKIKTIAVQENQAIQQGDVIAILEDESLQTKKQQSEDKIRNNKQQIQKIELQLTDLNQQIFAEKNRINHLLMVARAELEKVERDYQEKQQTTQGKVTESRANLQVDQEELQRLTADLEAAEAAVKGSESALQIAIEKRDRYREIRDSGALSKDRLDEAELQVTQSEQTLKERQANFKAQQEAIERQTNAVEATQARLQQALAAENPSD